MYPYSNKTYSSQIGISCNFHMSWSISLPLDFQNLEQGSRLGIDRPYHIGQICFMAYFCWTFKLRMLFKSLKGYEKEEYVSETLYGLCKAYSIYCTSLWREKCACLYSRSCSELSVESFCPALRTPGQFSDTYTLADWIVNSGQVLCVCIWAPSEAQASTWIC